MNQAIRRKLIAFTTFVSKLAASVVMSVFALLAFGAALFSISAIRHSTPRPFVTVMLADGPHLLSLPYHPNTSLLWLFVGFLLASIGLMAYLIHTIYYEVWHNSNN